MRIFTYLFPIEKLSIQNIPQEKINQIEEIEKKNTVKFATQKSYLAFFIFIVFFVILNKVILNLAGISNSASIVYLAPHLIPILALILSFSKHSKNKSISAPFIFFTLQTLVISISFILIVGVVEAQETKYFFIYYGILFLFLVLTIILYRVNYKKYLSKYLKETEKTKNSKWYPLWILGYCIAQILLILFSRNTISAILLMSATYFSHLEAYYLTAALHTPQILNIIKDKRLLK